MSKSDTLVLSEIPICLMSSIFYSRKHQATELKDIHDPLEGHPNNIIKLETSHEPLENN